MIVTDNFTTINMVKKKVIKFRNARNWKQFHKQKDLVAALSIEVSELQELFLWKSDGEISSVKIEKIREELADIFIYLLCLSECCEIDLSDAVRQKLNLNAKKYPVDKSYGSNKKYNEL